MKTNLRSIAVVAMLMLLFSPSYSQTDSDSDSESVEVDFLIDDLMEMSLEDLLNAEISVASSKATPTREVPSIVSSISAAEIARTGARDLIDVLRLVPGFQMGYDVQGVIGIGLRGNWAHEGKILLMVDGQQMNDNLFATNALGNHFDVSQIKRVEIIRGPGSAIYGGYAELGVINIITFSGEDYNGIKANVTTGAYENGISRTNVSVGGGMKIGDVDVSAKVFMGQSQWSGFDYTDIYGASQTMYGNSNNNPLMINTALKYKGLSARIIHDDYSTTTNAWFDELLPEPYKLRFKSTLGEIKYDYQVNEKLKITPRFNYVDQKPWYAGYGVKDEEFTVRTQRYTSNIAVSYDVNDNINIVTGVEHFLDRAENVGIVSSPLFNYNNSDAVAFNSVSLYLQGLYKTKIANITVGGRYMNHNAFDPIFAPRIGLTKVIGNFHAKALYSSSFRSPSIYNIDYNRNIDPELTTVAELEIGYKITSFWAVTANVFDITINKPIVYAYDDSESGSGVEGDYTYFNYPKSGSRGTEIESKMVFDWGTFNLNYAFYTGAGKNEVPDYEVPNSRSALVGMPQHALGAHLSYKITNKLIVTPSYNMLGKRFAYNSVNDEGLPVGEFISANHLINLNIRYDDLFTKGLSVGLGVFNLLNENAQIVQPYNGYSSPLPGRGREIVLNVGYTFKK